uniref:EF-hand domain-containing protein n=1 Tax=Chenopodium quinoa TaxID=63459 RepID=A0A803M223_CHEQI
MDDFNLVLGLEFMDSVRPFTFEEDGSLTIKRGQGTWSVPVAREGAEAKMLSAIQLDRGIKRKQTTFLATMVEEKPEVQQEIPVEIVRGSTKRELTTKDVEKFTRLWKVNNSEEVQDLMNMIKDDRNGSISCWDFYNLLCRRNMFGKQRIEMFDTQGQQNTSMFFPLMDKDEDGFLSSMDLRSFAAIFGRYPSDEAIDRVIRKLDIDGDGKISLQDFRGTMGPILDGMAWEFWLVAILLTFQL